MKLGQHRNHKKQILIIIRLGLPISSDHITQAQSNAAAKEAFSIASQMKANIVTFYQIKHKLLPK